MNISAPFIARPIATWLLAFAILLSGLLGYRALPVSALPEVDFPTIQVVTQLPGASPDTTATLITASLERQFGEIPGLILMTSISAEGTSQITLTFGLDRSMDSAAQDVQAAINAAAGTLPTNLPYPPTYSKVNPADAPILTLALTSDRRPIDIVSDAADTVLQPKLAEIDGVGRVTVQGNMRPAVRVRVDPARLAAYGMSMEDVRTAVANANANGAKGGFDGARLAVSLGANDQLPDAGAYRDLVIAWRNNAPVRLSAIGSVVAGVENDRAGATYDGKQAVVLDIQRQPGANIVQTVQAVKEALPRLQRAMPSGITLSIVTDRTETIRASVRDVQVTLIMSVVLVVLVIFLFLRSPRATFIPAVALPLSIIGTFGVMQTLGFALDNLSLMALTIATGFVVDDAIVMIENVVRYIERGVPPLQAAYRGAGQIGFTIVSLTVSLIAVFIPLLFMTGVVGRLFKEFSVTLAVSVVVSAVISLTLTPMMCGRLLHGDHGQPGLISRCTEAGFGALLAGYRRTLDWSFRHQPMMLTIGVLTLVGTIGLYIIAPKGFLPNQDTGVVLAVTEAAQSASIGKLAGLQARMAEAIRRDPAVTGVVSFVGAGTINTTPNTGRLTIALKPIGHRDPMDAVLARLRAATAGIPGLTAWFQPVQDIQISTRVSRTRYQYTLMDTDAAELAAWAPRLRHALAQRRELTNVTSDQANEGFRTYINVDRDAAMRLGVSMQAIADTLYDGFGQRQISTIFSQANQYRVILEADPAWQADPDSLRLLRVPATNGAPSSAPGSVQGSIQGSVQGNGPGNGQANGPGNGQGSTHGSVQGSVRGSTQGNNTPGNTQANAQTSGSAQVPLSAIARIERVTAPLVITHQAQFPAVTISFDVAPGYALAQAVDAIAQASAAIGMPDTITANYAGDAAEFQRSLAAEPWLIVAAVVVIYIVLGVLYESWIHPVTILSTLPSAGIGAVLALMLCGIDLSLVALVGIVLLMGIVKKNAIMMVDFALEAERTRGLAPAEAMREACLLRFRPIMMTTMAALLGAVPLVIERGAGSELRYPLGVTIIGGLLLSQFLTLYTTPAIYLGFERLRTRFRGAASPAAAE
ncbi:MAG TPA: efflux RND transporter permease subunit [Rhodopila sp.]|nr:efflux RND transporter permease subunit [Rhodopila sp.]